MRTFLFSSDPGPAEGAVAAKVQIVRSPSPAGGPWIKAKIIRMLRGSIRATIVKISPNYVSNCDVPPHPGEVGVVVGNVRALADGELSIDPARTFLRQSH